MYAFPLAASGTVNNIMSLLQQLNVIQYFFTVCPSPCDSKEVTLKKVISSRVPVIEWLSHYNWKHDLMSDIVSGITVAIMHIPQGMAYALLANVPAIVGIYMAFFPVLVYFIFGTSRHNSMGTFAVVCLMTGKAVLEHSDPVYFRSLDTIPMSLNTSTGYSPMQVASTVTFTVAMFQIAMHILKLGAVSAVLSETLVSGFTTGAAIQVTVSQFKDLLGLRIPKFKGYFVVYQTLHAIAENIGSANTAALIISAVTISVTSFNNEVLKPLVAKRSVFPIPIELIAVVLGSTVSYYCNLADNYGVRVVGDIPQGLPSPELPQFALIPAVIVDGLTIAIVSYAVTLSMALIFAQKLNYEIDSNQELLALGLSNIVGSCFHCVSICASLSRSLIQQVVGGKTQVVSLVSCSILVVILLWIGPFFEPLPKSVLASVIVVALKGMLLQVKDLVRFWKLSKMDALIWLITCLSVVVIGIDIGLLAGVAVSLVAILALNFRPYVCLLGRVPSTDMYVDLSRYRQAKQIDGVKIFQYSGGINFATRNIFKASLYELIELNPQKELAYRTKLAQKLENGEDLPKENDVHKITKLKQKVNFNMKCVILDFSMVSYIDPSGISMMKTVVEGFKKLDISVYVCGCNDPVYDMMEKCELIKTLKPSLRVFQSIHDAVNCSSSLFGIALDGGHI
ncbi:unnamed protein product [Acanthoscelides obtectus]|uniref:STAS domain-containing protein n=1 Tax=Acanthoscelides obtectus TaxID=200917 RepID=A0A9P0LTH1_ACAOB|nr:unnamed protein product [Acanthoscelides obtectus]CAK1667781.1 Prestin [Acanthoscelides obtectus]